MMLHETIRNDVFLAQHSVAALFRMVTTLFWHCNAVLRLTSSLRIVPCNITFIDKKSKHFPFGDHFINPHDLFLNDLLILFGENWCWSLLGENKKT